jgi:hypothetical protein
MRLAELHTARRNLLRAEEEAKVDRIDRFTSVADVVDRYAIKKS